MRWLCHQLRSAISEAEEREYETYENNEANETFPIFPFVSYSLFYPGRAHFTIKYEPPNLNLSGFDAVV